jgi:tRNA(adenine34) deaminase
MGGPKARASRKADRKRKWVAEVKTDSTHPPAGLFTKNAATIAKTLASKKVSPKGPGSGMRMLSYFINRAGRGLTARIGASQGPAVKSNPRSQGQRERSGLKPEVQGVDGPVRQSGISGARHCIFNRSFSIVFNRSSHLVFSIGLRVADTKVADTNQGQPMQSSGEEPA